MKMAATTRIFLLIFGVLMTSGAGQAAAETAPSGDNPATYRGPDREQRLLEGARKEGQVTVYSSMIADQALRPIQRFRGKISVRETANMCAMIRRNSCRR